MEDSTGGVIPNAEVTMKKSGTGETRQTRTPGSGEFNVPFLQGGQYSVTVGAGSFKTKTLTGITLQVDQTVNLRISLEVGQTTETIEVTGSSPLVDSSTSSLGQVIENKEILDMPLNGRNPFALGLLSGNTTPMFGMGSNLPFIAGGGRFSANEVTLDGVDNNTVSNAGSIGRNGIAVVPSVDAVQEFKVKTNNFSAEFGHAAGAVINATIKNGTNQFHGVAFEGFYGIPTLLMLIISLPTRQESRGRRFIKTSSAAPSVDRLSTTRPFSSPIIRARGRTPARAVR